MNTKKQNILKLVVLAISLLILVEFFIGVFTWNEHWWILTAWFLPFLGGMYYLKENKTDNAN
ncbi:MAG: hypothetical protein HRU50_06820 [Winogradskyella sp.]|uniref:hypothetical protein n=1 Tax=Winogradskyella sp. TaxID=1883156 RepID=UPI0025E1E288|nr:hypothetical protein [Winogradskyella sp.]NRB59644.1 hypothetical protein [Winogradskyella sp.]